MLMKSKICNAALATIITIMCVCGLTACQSSASPQPKADVTQQEGQTPQETAKNVNKPSTEPPKEVKNAQTNITPSIKNNFDRYLGLIGLPKNSLTSTLGEQPTNVDEGGWEFKNAGIRVWFKSNNGQAYVDQIFLQKQDIDFNGAKIGDPISVFEHTFGKPVTENKQSGEKHFKYKELYLSVNYDPNTNKTFAVYILKDNY